jgi:hypothetical protein
MEVPDPNIDQRFQIDEEQLSNLIVKVYKDRIQNFDEEEKEHTINQDNKSISAIYKLRRGRKPRTFREAEKIFVTTNSSLAYASKLFETQEKNSEYFFIPTVLTDVFIGTLVWIDSRAEVTNVNEKRLIANCYAALQPNKKMIRMLADKADEMNKDGTISEGDVSLLKMSRVARSILQEETLGDPDRFTEKTVTEILNQVRTEIRTEEKTRFDEDRRKFQKETEETQAKADEAEQKAREGEIKYSSEKDKKEQLTNHLENLSHRIANIFAWVLYVPAIILVLLVTAFSLFPNYFEINQSLKIILYCLAFLFGVISLITGFNIKGSRDVIKTRLQNKIYHIMLGNNGEDKSLRKLH